MSLTISTTGHPPDIDGALVTRAESLAQRIRAAFRFRLNEWFLAPGTGLDYDLVFTHQVSTEQAGQVLVNVARAEGGAEIVEIRDIEFTHDPATRRFTFQCVIDTIYSDPLIINETFGDA